MVQTNIHQLKRIKTIISIYVNISLNIQKDILIKREGMKSE